MTIRQRIGWAMLSVLFIVIVAGTAYELGSIWQALGLWAISIGFGVYIVYAIGLAAGE